MDLTIRHDLLNCSRWCTTIIVFIYQCTPENCEPWELKDQNYRKSFPLSYSKNPRHHEMTMKKRSPEKQKSKQTISIIFKALPNGQNKSETPKKGIVSHHCCVLSCCDVRFPIWFFMVCFSIACLSGKNPSPRMDSAPFPFMESSFYPLKIISAGHKFLFTRTIGHRLFCSWFLLPPVQKCCLTPAGPQDEHFLHQYISISDAKECQPTSKPTLPKLT